MNLSFSSASLLLLLVALGNTFDVTEASTLSVSAPVVGESQNIAAQSTDMHRKLPGDDEEDEEEEEEEEEEAEEEQEEQMQMQENAMKMEEEAENYYQEEEAEEYEEEEEVEEVS